MPETNIMELTVFSILTLFTLGGSIVMVTNKQTLFCAFGFLVAMIGLAGMFALLENRFLAVAQIMVSVGAIVVLSTLTILTINIREKSLPRESDKFKWIFFTTILVAPFTYLLYKSLSIYASNFTPVEAMDTKIVGAELFSTWALPFEILSILLLSAMLGAIVIARKEKKERR